MSKLSEAQKITIAIIITIVVMVGLALGSYFGLKALYEAKMTNYEAGVSDGALQVAQIAASYGYATVCATEDQCVVLVPYVEPLTEEEL